MTLQVKIAIVLFVLAAAVGGGVAYFVIFRPNSGTPPAVSTNAAIPVQTGTNAAATTDGGSAVPAVNSPVAPVNACSGDSCKPRAVDTDQDGLSDDEEKKYGTNPNNPDTDGDGIPDVDEIKIYHTNPLEPNTVPR